MHLADVHLAAKPYNMEERREDVFRTFETVVDIILRDRPDAVVIAGDLFDKPRPPLKDLKRAARLFRALDEKGINVIVAHGEHDTPHTLDETVLTLLDAMLDRFKAPVLRRGAGGEAMLRNLVIDLNGLTVFVTPFFREEADKRKNSLLKIFRYFDDVARGRMGKKILLGHFALDVELPYDAPVSPLELPESMDYVALGHIHSKRIRLDSRVPYAYPGVLDPLRIDEIKTPGSPLWVDLSGDSPGVEEIRLERRPQAVVEVDYNRGSESGGLHTGSDARRWLVAEVRRKILAEASKYPGKRPLIHLVIKSSGDVPKALVIREGVRAASEAGALLKIHWKVAGKRDDLKRGLVHKGSLSLVKIVSDHYKIPEQASALILQDLVDSAISGDEEGVVRVLEKLAAKVDKKVWESILGVR